MLALLISADLPFVSMQLNSKYCQGLTIETNIFASEIKIILGLKSSHPGYQVVEIGLNGPVANRVKFWKYFYGLIIERNNFYFVVKVIPDLENTYPDG